MSAPENPSYRHAPSPDADGEGFLQFLLDTYWRPLVAYAGRFLDSRDDAEDAVQEAFARMWIRKEAVDPETVRAWLYTLVHHIAVDERRKRAVRARWRDTPPDYIPPRTPLQLVEDSHTRQLIDEAIQRLPERRREAFVLAHLHGLTYGEIAQVLGISPQTVANQVSSALAELRQSLAGAALS